MVNLRRSNLEPYMAERVMFDPAAVRDGCDGLQAGIARLAQGVVQALV